MAKTPPRPILSYYGGKWRLAPWIISHLPEHRIYVEPCGGAASVLMRKPRSYSEVINDIDGEIVNVYRVLRDPALSRELARKLELTPYARAEFDEDHTVPTDPVDRARLLMLQSFGSYGQDGGFRSMCNTQGTSFAMLWSRLPTVVQLWHRRLKAVVIENRDAVEVVEQQDTPATLHYVDPPYPHNTRSRGNVYRHEMDDDDHRRLMEALLAVKGMVAISTYPNQLYSRLVTEHGWRKVTKYTRNNNNTKVVEALYLNPACAQKQPQKRLFSD